MIVYLALALALPVAGSPAAAAQLQTVIDKRGEKWAVFPTDRPDLDRIRLLEAQASRVPAKKIEIVDPATGLTIPAPETAARKSNDRRVTCSSVTYDRMRTARLYRDPEYRAMARCIKGRAR